MVGANTLLRLIGGTLALIVIAWVTSIGFMLFDPIYNNVIDPSELTGLGWGAPQDTVMLFASLGLIGLSIVIIIWWHVAPVRQDKRQELRRGPPL